MSGLKNRIRRIEEVHGATAEKVQMTEGFIDCDSIEEWLEICRAIDAANADALTSENEIPGKPEIFINTIMSRGAK